MHATIKQSAWEDGAKLFKQGERWFANFSHQRLNVKHPLGHNLNFHHWLAGVTDGDGCFSLTFTKKGGWAFDFKISLSLYNQRTLYFIKTNIGAGKVTYAGEGMCQYRIRDRDLLKKFILPIFDRHSLFSVKAYDYQVFKSALFILEDASLSTEEKNAGIQSLKAIAEEKKKTGISPAWNNNNVPCKSWVVGFHEAEGSFYITKKDENRYCHGYGLSQKTDRIIFDHFRSLFRIVAKVQRKKAGHWQLDTTNRRNLKTIRDYFKDTFKGVKSFEFRIWDRAFRHYGNAEKLKEVQAFMRRIRHPTSDSSEDEA